MKKGLCAVLLLGMILLTACTNTRKTEQAKNLEFPGLTWGMTPEEVLEVFQTEKEDSLLYNENSLIVGFGIPDIELFGQKAKRVFFTFVDFSSFENMPKKEDIKEEGRRLCRIQAEYSQDTDMKPVKEHMEQTYGATISEYYPFDKWMGSNGEYMRLQPWKESESVKYWGSSTLENTIPENDLEAYQTYWKYCRDGLNDENWDFFKEHARMVSVIFSDQEGETGKGLEWDAHNLAVYQVLTGQMEK